MPCTLRWLRTAFWSARFLLNLVQKAVGLIQIASHVRRDDDGHLRARWAGSRPIETSPVGTPSRSSQVIPSFLMGLAPFLLKLPPEVFDERLHRRILVSCPSWVLFQLSLQLRRPNRRPGSPWSSWASGFPPGEPPRGCLDAPPKLIPRWSTQPNSRVATRWNLLGYTRQAMSGTRTKPS